jgi:uncharacterized protein
MGGHVRVASSRRLTHAEARTYVLRAVDEQRVLCRRVEWAGSFGARLAGLMGRSDLPSGEGLFLPGTNSIHMLFMRFSIDALFLSAPAVDGTRKVVAVRQELRPWRGVVWYVRGARGVVELPSGEAKRMRVQPGDVVRLDEAPGEAT